MGLVMVYAAYQLQFSMGVLRLFALLLQSKWRSCISSHIKIKPSAVLEQDGCVVFDALLILNF